MSCSIVRRKKYFWSHQTFVFSWKDEADILADKIAKEQWFGEEEIVRDLVSVHMSSSFLVAVDIDRVIRILFIEWNDDDDNEEMSFAMRTQYSQNYVKTQQSPNNGGKRRLSRDNSQCR